MSRNFMDDKSRLLVVDTGEAHSTSEKEAHRIIIDALIDYYRAAPISFWRTMRRLNIHVVIGESEELLVPNVPRLLCPNCGVGDPKRDSLCPRCVDKEESKDLTK